MRLWKRRGSGPGAFRAYGVPVEVELEDPSLWPVVEAVLPPNREPCDPGDARETFTLRSSGLDTYEMVIGEIPFVEHAELDVAIGALDQQLRLFIAASAPDNIFVHAGVVAVGDRALLIPGQSFSGKTTLVQALVRAGATYLSDEYAVLDAEGRVHPYARRLSVRDASGLPLREQHVDELGGVAAEKSVAAAIVLLTRFRADARFAPVVRTRAEGVVVLLANTVPAQLRPRDSMRAITRALQDAEVLEGDRGEATEVAGQLLQMLRAKAETGASVA